MATRPTQSPADVRTALDETRTYLEKKHGDGNPVLLPSVAVADLLVTLSRAREALP